MLEDHGTTAVVRGCRAFLCQLDSRFRLILSLRRSHFRRRGAGTGGRHVGSVTSMFMQQEDLGNSGDQDVKCLRAGCTPSR